MSNLSFERLRHANLQRAGIWNAGAKWDAADRVTEMCGEQGELGEALIAFFLYAKFTRHVGKIADISKKLKRIEGGMIGNDASQYDALMQAMKDEAGDAQITLDLFCMEMAIDLGQVTAEKFNKTSDKHSLPVKILCDFDADGLPVEQRKSINSAMTRSMPVAGTSGKVFIDSAYLDESRLLMKTHGLSIQQLKDAGGLSYADVFENLTGMQPPNDQIAINFVNRIALVCCHYEGCPSREQRIAGGPCAICYE